MDFELLKILKEKTQQSESMKCCFALILCSVFHNSKQKKIKYISVLCSLGHTINNQLLILIPDCYL